MNEVLIGVQMYKYKDAALRINANLDYNDRKHHVTDLQVKQAWEKFIPETGDTMPVYLSSISKEKIFGTCEVSVYYMDALCINILPNDEYLENLGKIEVQGNFNYDENTGELELGFLYVSSDAPLTERAQLMASVADRCLKAIKNIKKQMDDNLAPYQLTRDRAMQKNRALPKFLQKKKKGWAGR